MLPVPVILRNTISKVRVWAVGLTGIAGSIIYFEGESYQSAISDSFHIPDGLIEPSAAEKFILGVMTLLSHHIVHIVLIVGLLPIFIGVALMVRRVLRRTWKRLKPRLRLRLTEAWVRLSTKVKGWMGEPEFHFLTMPITAAVMLSLVFGFITASFALSNEGTMAGNDEATRLKEIAKRCSIGRGYVNETPSCSTVRLRSGNELTGLLFNTSGSNLFLSDGERTKVIDLGSVDSIADVRAVTERPAKPLVQGKEVQAITR